MKKHAKTLILALCCALLLSSAVYAASRTRTLEVTYSDIKLVVDGNAVTPRDATGAVVEPFIYEGTTYLPVRAVGEALGKQVSWDGNTKTVYVGAVPGQDIYLLNVCPPYETGLYYKAPEYFSMMGTKYFHGFKMANTAAFAYFNLNGEYSTLEFDFGHVDEAGSNTTASYNIYLDGEYVKTIEGSADMMIEHVILPLNHALQLKIVAGNAYNVTGDFGFGNVKVK